MRFNKITIILVVFLFLLGVVLVIITKTKKQEAGGVVQPMVVSPPPISPYQPGAPQNVLFSFSPTFSVSLPKRMTVYSVTPTNTAVFTKTIVSKLAYSPTESSIVVSGEQTRAWTWQTGSAAISESNAFASFYFSDVGREGGGWTLLELQKVLSPSPELSFVQESNPVALTGALNFPYDNSFGTPTRYAYSYTIQRAPVLLGTPEERSITLVVDAKERVRYASFVLPLQTVSSVSDVAIIKQQDILSNLNAQKGMFVGSNREGQWENDNPIEFSSVLLASGKIAYVFDAISNMLLPALLLDGTGSNATTSVSVRYLLMATR